LITYHLLNLCETIPNIDILGNICYNYTLINHKELFIPL
jgi:hypothetical protein